ncbi:MAG: PD-(D/E)XK nuclease family protein [Candidatus Pacebacteria bacterium]|nr:PD-(D/E)XK nuclease family protein [Candidatus Paceibacterota bacterium]MBP9840667.1 PD-(D/E)XK nuclease family protein [Candidatus Paceibacterota bacterium]
MRKKAVKRHTKTSRRQKRLPIDYWSHSSVVSYLRNPLAWFKRYVMKIYDTPRTPAGIVGSAAHVAMEQFYLGATKEAATEAGLVNLRSVADFEINFGTAKTKKAKKAKREGMEREYLQAVGYYLARPPKHKVIGVEVRGYAKVPGHRLSIKAISDLVVESTIEPGALDIVDHKFVDSFSKEQGSKALFWLQAIFNYYTVSKVYGKPVRRFIVIECKKTRNANGKSQLRRYVIDYKDADEAFSVFHRLLKDVTYDLAHRKKFLPNPSDMFEGQDSFDVYRLGLAEEEKEV